MDVNPNFSQHAEEISTAEEENIEEKHGGHGHLALVADEAESSTEIESNEHEHDFRCFN